MSVGTLLKFLRSVILLKAKTELRNKCPGLQKCQIWFQYPQPVKIASQGLKKSYLGKLASAKKLRTDLDPRKARMVRERV